MVLSRLTKITGPGVSTDTNWVGNNADFTGITTTATSFNIGVTTIHSTLIESHNIVSTGVITATSFSGDGSALTGVANTDFVVGTAITMGTANFTGNVTIGGTLTYEDVTNIDSVGIITAQKDIHVGAGVSAVGVVTATTFSGSGASLTGIANANISASAAIAGSKIAAQFDGQDITGRNINLTHGTPTLGLISNSANPDFMIQNQSGKLIFQDTTNTVNRLVINTDGHIDVAGNLDCAADFDVDGHTNLDNVSIAGVTTFSDDVTFTGTNYTGAIWDKSEDHLKLKDNTKLRLGSGLNDFNARHDGTYTWLQNAAGPLLIDCSSQYIALISGNNLAGGKMARFIHNGAAELYWDNSKKLTTTPNGIDVTGGLSVTGIVTASTYYGDGSNLSNITSTTINNNADNRIITGSGTANTLNGESGLTFNGTDLVMNTSGGRIFCTRTTGEAAILIGSGNAGGATLYLDGDSNGDWSGGDYAYIRHNTNGHLHIVADNPAAQGAIDFFTGNTTYHGTITSDGILSMNGASNSRAIEINPGGNAGTIVLDRNGYITSMIRASDGGSNVAGGSGGGSRIHLAKTQMHFQTFPYTSNIGDAVTYTTRCSIDTSGHFVPGADNTYDLGTSSLRWRDIYTGDLHLSNETKGANDVDGSWGDWTLQEGESDVFMINNRSGKKFKIKMEEVD